MHTRTESCQYPKCVEIIDHVHDATEQTGYTEEVTAKPTGQANISKRQTRRFRNKGKIARKATIQNIKDPEFTEENDLHKTTSGPVKSFFYKTEQSSNPAELTKPPRSVKRLAIIETSTPEPMTTSRVNNTNATLNNIIVSESKRRRAKSKGSVLFGASLPSHSQSSVN